jgi:pyruvate,water dikinase
MSFTIPLSLLRHDDLELAGGKGANLGALIAAGFPVPPGFCITTRAYDLFVNANGLREAIAGLAAIARIDDPASLEEASTQIRARFEAAPVPAEIAAEIEAAYAQLGSAGGEAPVAVRSSATAEDLPDLSFAGQQDTYLNITGREALLEAVRRCWGSLWTARAIGYRLRSGIDQETISLAVIVQAMVQAESSGVLFTANPLTGLRRETVIDAALGLGEALVSGQVEPDHYVVDPTQGRILSKALGAKALSIRGRSGGGTFTVSETAAARQALDDAQILALACLGQQVEAHFGAPQDIEWALAGGELFLVQSRPVTSLYPTPEGSRPEPLELFLSLGAVQGMLDPMTPFGQDGIGALAASGANLFGYSLSASTQRIMLPAGERLFINITGLARNRIGRKLLPRVLSVVEAGGETAIGAILADPRLAPGRRPVSLATALRLARAFAPLPFVALRNVLFPGFGRKKAIERVEALLEEYRRKTGEARSLSRQTRLIGELFSRLPPFMGGSIIPLFGPGMGMLYRLNALAARLPGGEALALEITRGMPHNVTTEMDLALWRTAQAVRGDPESARRFAALDATVLAAAYQNGSLPTASQAAVETFLKRYGVRGVAELDIGRPRWGDDPAYVFQVLKSYLQITDPEQAPDRVFARRAKEAEAAIEKLARALMSQPGGRLKALQARFLAGQVRFLARRVRALAGLRELPKFLAVSLMALIRGCLLASGKGMAAAGLLFQPEDIFFLRLAELEELAPRQKPGGKWDGDLRLAAFPSQRLAEMAAERRARYDREKRRKQVPRLLLSDGRAFYGGVQGQAGGRDGSLAGSPVSPGVAEGQAHVVLDPRGVQLQPGEILVCPGTDPAWTPLFLAAGGLVMEVGGMMTHGSVVAREYGIPAVVGVHEATTRLKTGQRLRVDGTRGEVIILEEASATRS